MRQMAASLCVALLGVCALPMAAERNGLAGEQEARVPGTVFRDCDWCPEMVVMPGGRLALGRYEVTVGEYRAFATATGGGGDSWRDPDFPQTDGHPVVNVSWDDAQEYLSWLSRTAGAAYRLPTEEEWERAATGSEAGCYEDRTGNEGTCPVGTYGSNAAGLSDMVGNVYERTEDCFRGNCDRRGCAEGSLRASGARRLLGRGRPWGAPVPGARARDRTDLRANVIGFRVARALD